jgi:hypothetical protein
MERTTRKHVEGIFEIWVKSIGGKLANSYNDVGGYRLDYNGIYGGFKVEQIHNENGGVSDNVFSCYRMKASEMYRALYAAIESIRQYELNRKIKH